MTNSPNAHKLKTCKCGKPFRAFDVVVYVFNYIDSYIKCLACKKEMEVKRNNHWLIWVLKITVFLGLLFCFWKFLSQGMFRDYNGEHADYYNSYTGQVHSKLDDFPFFNYYFIGSLTLLSTCVVMLPASRVINWVAWGKFNQSI